MRTSIRNVGIRTLFGFGIALALLCLAWGLGLVSSPVARYRNKVAHAPFPIQTSAPYRQQVVILGEVTGVVKAGWSLPAQAESSGVVEWVGARMGDYVDEGTVLAVLNAMEVRLDVDAATKALNAAKRDVDTANDYFHHIQRLYKEKHASDALMNQAKTTLGEAKAKYQVAQEELKQGKRLKRSRQVIAPCAGVVTECHVHPGDPVWACKPLFILADPDYMVFETQIEPDLASRFPLGCQVRLLFPPPGGEATGTVEEIRELGGRVMLRASFLRHPGLQEGGKAYLSFIQGTKHTPLVISPTRPIHKHAVLGEAGTPLPIGRNG